MQFSSHFRIRYTFEKILEQKYYKSKFKCVSNVSRQHFMVLTGKSEAEERLIDTQCVKSSGKNCKQK